MVSIFDAQKAPSNATAVNGSGKSDLCVLTVAVLPGLSAQRRTNGKYSLAVDVTVDVTVGVTVDVTVGVTVGSVAEPSSK